MFGVKTFGTFSLIAGLPQALGMSMGLLPGVFSPSRNSNVAWGAPAGLTAFSLASSFQPRLFKAPISHAFGASCQMVVVTCAILVIQMVVVTRLVDSSPRTGPACLPRTGHGAVSLPKS